jgi:REP element-mobilizing transposase RayT
MPLLEAIIRKTCRELDIEIIDIAVNPDHFYLFEVVSTSERV